MGSGCHLETERLPDSCSAARCWQFLRPKGVPVVAIHNGLPFGAAASVVAWHRVGEALARLARRLLMVPVLRYVDDYFGAERQACDICSLVAVSSTLARPSLVEATMKAFVRLIRAILGPTSIADRKVECGSTLTVLGVEVPGSVAGCICQCC